MIALLPDWILTNQQPAFLDAESGSVIEQTARMYAKVNELVNEYNLFTANIDNQIKEFIAADEKSKAEHMTAIRQEFQDFIDIINLKILELEKQIDDAEKYMRTNLVSTTESVVSELLANESIIAKLNYNSDTKSLNINLGGGE